MKNLHKLVFSLVLSIGLVFAVAKQASAAAAFVNDGVSKQAVTVSSVSQNTLVCGEAWGVGRSWNLGCTQWVENMEVSLRSDMPKGNYSVWFSSRDNSGVWRKVSDKVMVTKSVNAVTTTVSAAKLNHAYKPYQVNQAAGDPANSIHARVDNFTDRSVKVTLCAEAVGMGKNWHLGCLPQKVELNRIWSDPWAIDMNVYARSDMPSGVYSVRYTYQDEGGKWHDVKNLETGRSVRTMLSV